MAEDFPHYRHEDDDDTPHETRQERPASPPAHEHHPPVQQEGTIFSRDEVAPHLSRPLFDFIRKQEQPEARAAEPEPPKPEALPSVSHPQDPEVHTYQPPVGPEAAVAAHIAEVNRDAAEDDDDDSEDTAPTHQPRPVASPAEQPEARSLNEQFEDIMRSEVGEDFAEQLSGDQLGVTPNRASREETAGTRDVEIVDTDVAGNATGHQVVETEGLPVDGAPLSPAEASALADLDEDIDEHAPIDYGSPVPDGVTEAGAFYYNESPDPAMAGAGTTARGRRSWRGSAEPTASYASGSSPIYTPSETYGAPASGEMPTDPDDPDTPVPPRMHSAGMVAPPPPPLETASSAAMAIPNLAPVRQERRENHNARWFIAGFITGWVVKQHLANKKLGRVQKAHGQEMRQRDERIDSLQLRQQAAGRELQRTQGELQQTRATQAAEANEKQREQYRAEAAARAERRQAAANPGQTAGEQLAAAAAVPTSEQGSPSAQSATEAATPEQRQPAALTPEQTRPAPAAQRQGEQSSTTSAFQTAEALVAAPFAAAMGARAEAPAAAHAPEAFQAAQPSSSSQERILSPQQSAQEAVNQAFGLAPGQRVEHAAGGGHDIIVDSHGREVQGARVYGEEFHSQQRKEQSPVGAADDQRTPEITVEIHDATNPAAATTRRGQTDARRGIVSGLGGGGTLGSGLVDARHEIGAGASAARKRLTANIPKKNENPLVATLASPWLWASVFVLVAAFFVAAFI